jgi:hypothetical protein
MGTPLTDPEETKTWARKTRLGPKRKAASVGGTEAAYERSGGLTATEREKKPIASLTRT